MFGSLSWKPKSRFLISYTLRKREEKKGAGKEESNSRTKKEGEGTKKSREMFNKGHVVSLQ